MSMNCLAYEWYWTTLSRNMNPAIAKQVALDNSLVPSEKRLKIEECNARIEFSKPQREETYQVTLDALKLSPCYPAFLITAEVPKVFFLVKGYLDFMYQDDNKEISSARKEHMPYPRFTKVIINHFISKDKTIFMRNRINLHTIRDDSLLDFATGKATPKKARKYEKVASPFKKVSFVLEEEPTEKPKRARKPAKKSTTVPTAGVAIKDTLSESVPKNKTPAKVDRGKGMDLLYDAALLKVAQVKEALKKSKKESYMLHPCGSGDGVGSKPKVPAESEDKTTGTDEGTDSGDDGRNDDDSDEVTKDDDEDDVESDANKDKEASDSEKMDSDEDENLNVNQNDDEEEEHEEEYVRTPDSFEFNDDDEEYDELYKDVNVRSKVAEHKEVGKGDAEMTDTTHESASQEKSYEQVIEDAHVTLTSSQKTEGSKQSSSVSSDFASKFLNLDNVPPVIDEVASMMNVKTPHEELSTQAPPNLSVHVTAIPETSTVHVTTVTLIIQPFSSIPQMTTPTPVPITEPTTSSIPAFPDFASLFGFDQRVYALEQEHSQVKQVDHSTQILTQIPAIVDEHLSTRIGFPTQTALQSYTAEFEKKAQVEKEKYIDIIKKSVKEIIKDEVKSQLPQILPKEISDFATPVIQNTINESLENILLDKLEKSKSYRAAEQHRELYDALVKSYQLNKDLFDSYGSKSQSKSSGKSAQVEELVFETVDTEIPQDQGDNLGNTKDQPNVEEASKHDWFKKPERPQTPDRDWNAGKQIDFRPPQTWISKMAKSGKPPTTFDELMSTPIDFSTYVLHNLKIENLTQEHLVGPAFNLLKRTCKSQVELKFHFKECYKAITDKLDWHNPEGHEYPFDISKPLPLIEYQCR
ncbi:hypothetical protein Tco_0439405 [Tanacetum coccineum]